MSVTPEPAAQESCLDVAQQHYENFPVASILLPRRLRQPVAAIYAFARSADDIADEGTAPDSERLSRLDGYAAGLDAIESGETPAGFVFTALGQAIRRHGLPLAPFRALLSAFRQDVTQRRYADFSQLHDYCRRSANPVGQLMLHLFRRNTAENRALSDSICTGLQLVNFLQDIDADYARGRIYLPQDAMQSHGVGEGHIRDRLRDPAWRALMSAEIDRARAFLLTGVPLCAILHGRPGLEIRLTLAGALTVLDKLRRIHVSGRHGNGRLARSDWARLLWRACFPGA
jgi:phytoene synthase